jgi:hypothetical protein
MNHAQFSVIGLYWIVALISCSTPFAAPTPRVLSLQERVIDARKKWESRRIGSYTIRLGFSEDWTRHLNTRVNATVENGQVLNSTCDDGICPAFEFRKIYTVEDLFAYDEWWANKPECVSLMEFDEEFGFPKYAVTDCPTVTDDLSSFRVILFKELSK